MNYTDMSPQQRNRLIAERVMDWHDMSCPSDEHEVYADYYWQCRCGWIGPISEPLAHTIPVPRYHEDMAAAWTIIQHIAALPDTPFATVRKKRQFLRMLGLGLCDNPSYFAATIQQLAALTPETICTAALYVFGNKE